MLFFIAICAIIVFVVFLRIAQGNFTSTPEKTDPGNAYNNLPYTDDLMVRFCRVINKELICIIVN